MSSGSASAVVQGAELVDVTRSFETSAGRINALDGLNLSINPGEFLVLMGVSGSGKSTLINVLAGLLPPSSGQVTSFGVSLHDSSPDELSQYRRTVSSVVFQEYNLMSMLTARENIEFSLEVAGVARADTRKRAERSLAKVGMSEFTDRYPGQLSGGQRQRVAIARALAGDRPLVLADEPTGSLDENTSGEIRALLRGLTEAGGTVVVATHDPAFIQIADRVARMHGGRVTEEAA